MARLWRGCRLLVVVGPGGIGKTAFVRRVAMERAGAKPVRAFDASADVGLLDGLEGLLGLPALSTPDDDRVLRIATTMDRDEATLVVDDLHVLGERGEAQLLAIVALLRRGRILATTRRPLDPGELAASWVVVTLGPLELDDATRLVRTLLDRLGKEADVPALARASAGSPLFCRLLVGGASGPGALLGGLGDDVRAVLERLAIDEGPLPASLFEESEPALEALEARFLVERAEDRVWLHDVVREAVLGRLDPARRATLHREAAERHARAGRISPRLRHLEAAGDAAALAEALDAGGDAHLLAQLRVGDYLRILGRIEAAGIVPTPRLRLRRALAFLSQGRADEARDEFARLGEPAPRDRALHAALAVRILREEGAPASARQAVFRSVFGLREPGGDPADWGELVMSHFWECMHVGDWPEAERVCRETLAVAGLVDPISRARVLRIHADVLADMGELGAAIRRLGEAEAEATALGSPSLLVFVHGSHVQCHTRLGEIDLAERRLERAKAIPVRELGAREQASRAFREADVLAAAGRMADAAEVLEDCGTRNPDLAIGLEAFRLSSLAAIASEAGDLRTAKGAAHALLAIPRARRPRHYGLEAPITLGRVDLVEGRPGRAARRARLAIEMARRAGLRLRAVSASILLSEALALQGRVDDARAVAEGAIDEARAMGALGLEARAVLSLATTLLRAGRGAAARREADRATTLARRAGALFVLARATVARGLADLAQGDDRAAAERLKTARAAKRRVRAPVLDAEIRLLDLAIRARAGSRAARAALRKERSFPLAADGPAGHDLWMDASTGRVVVDGSRELALAQKPILARLLATLLARPKAAHDKGDLFARAWRLPYKPSRDATLYKAVARLGALLDPRSPKRFLRWDPDGGLRLAAEKPEISTG